MRYGLVLHELHHVEHPQHGCVAQVSPEDLGIEVSLSRLHCWLGRSWSIWVGRQAVILWCGRRSSRLWCGLLLWSHYWGDGRHFVERRLWLGRKLWCVAMRIACRRPCAWRQVLERHSGGTQRRGCQNGRSSLHAWSLSIVHGSYWSSRNGHLWRLSTAGGWSRKQVTMGRLSWRLGNRPCHHIGSPSHSHGVLGHIGGYSGHSWGHVHGAHLHGLTIHLVVSVCW